MKMRYHKIAGAVLFLIGIVLIFNSFSGITGFAVLENIRRGTSSVLGLVFVIAGLVLFVSLTDEQRYQRRKSMLENLIEKESEKKVGGLSSKTRYVKGLEKIKNMIDGIDIAYRHTTNSGLKYNLNKRLKKLHKGLLLRKKYWYEVPFHSIDKTIDKRRGKHKEFPDWGLWGYKPFKFNEKNVHERGSKKIELSLVHYTEKECYDKIKRAFESGKDDTVARIITDENGYSFFLDKPVEEGIKITTLRKDLGIGKQTYTGKTKSRTPEYYIKFKLKIPKERVFKKSEKYEIGRLNKYAIAGGINRNDLLEDSKITGGRYKDEGLLRSIASGGYSDRGEETWKV